MKRREKIVLRIYSFYFILFFEKTGVMLGKGAGLRLFLTVQISISSMSDAAAMLDFVNYQ